MGCVPAELCKKALADATALAPNRNRGSDGICGDASHQSRPSDHNAGNAFDLTHDPAHGFDAHHWAQATKNQNPPWVTYIISNGRIWNPSISPEWRPYTGSNPHDHHAHWSINPAWRDRVDVIFAWSNNEEAELMAAADDIIAAVNTHTDTSNATQGQSRRVIEAWGQLHRFEVDSDGRLRHQWFDPAAGAWYADTWAEGCDPAATPDIAPEYKNQMHVFAAHRDPDKVVHAFVDLTSRAVAAETIPR
jgi:hypothetical protein